MEQRNVDIAIKYIQLNIGVSLANRIEKLICGHELGIDKEITTYANWLCIPFPSNHQHSPQYHALMALLTCQRVFFSDLWPKMSGLASTLTVKNMLLPDWGTYSSHFWRNKTESQIRDGIRMFISTTNNQDYLANVAQRWRPSCPFIEGFLTATRERFTGDRLTATCYDAVMLWLFKSGLVSLPWLLKYRNANTEPALTEAFGSGTVIWEGAFRDEDELPVVPRGHIVHIFEHPHAWNGHWMVSLGKGLAAGVNNNDENPPVCRYYYTALSLKKQFLSFGLDTATAIVINPFFIPDRH